MATPSLERQVEVRLRDRDVRYTAGRRMVVTALSRADGPRSAAELHDQIGAEVPLSSLYRTLATLEEAGILAPHFGTRGITRYELAEWLRGHHHHLICVECGSVDDIDIAQPFEAQVRELVDQIARTAGFSPTDHALEIEGRCARCEAS